MATSVCSRSVVGSLDLPITTKSKEGKIFGTEVDPSFLEELSKWPSLGHYTLDKLSNQNANKLIFADHRSNREWTGKELHDKILNVASALVDVYQFKPNTAVCIHYINSDISTILALGVIVAGGIVACSYPKDPYPEVLHMARKVEPKFIFCHQHELEWAAKLEADMGYPVFGIVMGDKANEEHLQFQHIQHLLNYDHKQSHAIRHLPVACLDTRTQTGFILMSSGTTGKPKAVPATHWCCLVDMIGFESRINRANDQVFATPAALDYTSGRMLHLGAISYGYKLVLIDEFTIEKYLEVVQSHKVSALALGVATLFNVITYDKIDNYDLSSLRTVFPMGAKVVYLDELRKFLDKRAYIKNVIYGYGASEYSVAVVSCVTPGDFLRSCDNCGPPVPGAYFKVVDTSSGKILDPNEPGMLHVKSMPMFPGYYDIQEKHRRCQDRINKKKQSGIEADDDTTMDSPFISNADIFDADGFYITGDIGYLNEDGHVFIMGRQKEVMACRGSKKVMPIELEDVISEHNCVSRVCVLGIPKQDEPLVMCPRAFVVPVSECYDETSTEFKKKLECKTNDRRSVDGLEHTGSSKLCRLDPQVRRLLAEDLILFVNDRVGWEKQLTGGIVILDDIPTMRETGKMNKSYLRNLTEEEISIYGDTSTSRIP